MLDGGPSQEQCERRSLEAIGAPLAHASGLSGRGVLLGFADYGFDLRHPGLRRADAPDCTRFRALWSQSDGRVWHGADIDAGLADAYDPHANYYGPTGKVATGDGAHGTLMAGIAAASRFGSFVGVAPDADLLGVHLDLPDHAWREHDAAGTPDWDHWHPAASPRWSGWKSYADASAIVGAIEFLSDEARRSDAQALVINLSVGTWAGPHDGRSAVARAITAAIARGEDGDGPPCAVVVGAGNAGADRGHVAGEVAAGGCSEIVWRFPAQARRPDKLEIWLEAADGRPADITCAITAKSDGAGVDAPSFAVTPACTTDIRFSHQRIGVADLTPFASGVLTRIRISLDPRRAAQAMPALIRGGSAWSITLTHATGAAPVRFHAWRERNDSPHASTLDGHTRSSTLCDFACAAGAIVAGGYDPWRPVTGADFAYASHGPAPWSSAGAIAAPLVGAPAHGVFGPRSNSATTMPTSGTSPSAALVSGAAALIFQHAANCGRRLNQTDLIAALASGGGRPTSDAALGFGPLWLPHALGLQETARAARSTRPRSPFTTTHAYQREVLT